MIANLLIESAEKALDPSNIFQGEPDEMHEKITITIKIMDKFQEAFEYVRETLDSYYRPPESETDEVPVKKPWTFHRRNVFQRLIDFVDRISVVNSILQTFIDFSKLEKVEIGGIKGRYLSAKCAEIYEEFNKSYNLFQNIQYEVLDTKDNSLIKDYENFQLICADYDKRLAAVLTQAFDDCYNLETMFKYLNIAANMFARPYISQLVKVKYNVITKMFDDELNTVKELYDLAKTEGVPIDNSFPPLAGTILWLRRLYFRVSKPGEEFKLIEDEILTDENTEFVFKKLDEMLQILTEDQTNLLQEWFSKLPDQIRTSMSKFQILRDSDGLLALNFDKELQAIFREIRYLKSMEIENLPPEAEELFKRSEEIFQAIVKFNRIIEWYNYLKKKTSDVEYDLIEHELSLVDDLLQQVTESLTWDTNSKILLCFVFANHLKPNFQIRKLSCKSLIR